jgi:serine/threonine protein kinase
MFQAPEMSGQTSFVPSADVYSFGVLLWRFFHRKLPKLSIEELENGIKLPCDDVLGFQSCQIDTLFEACTDLDPTKRPNMTEVIQFLHAIWTEARAKYGWTQPQALEFKPSVVTLSEHLPKAVYLNQWALGPNVYEKY